MDDLSAKEHTGEAIVLVPTACRDSQINTGLSKFGGSPDLPENFQLNLEFQFFVGQINFAQINCSAAMPCLPGAGLLSLFLTSSADGSYSAQAKYFASTDGLQRILIPPKKHPCHPCRLTPHFFQSQSCEGFEGFEGFEGCDAAEYVRYEQKFLERFYPHKQEFDFDTPWHQMLGFYRDVARRKLMPDKDCGRVLLLQIDSDSLVSLSWGYNGQLYFWIEESDLAAKNFANVKVEFAQAPIGLRLAD
jgi:uncharacterized protein YwqG